MTFVHEVRESPAVRLRPCGGRPVLRIGFDLAAGVWLKQTVGVPIQKETARQKEKQVDLRSSRGCRRTSGADHPEEPRLAKQGYQEVYGGGQCTLRKMGSLTAAYD